MTDSVPREIPIPEVEGTMSDTQNRTQERDVTMTPMPSPPPVRRYPARSHQLPERYVWTPNSHLEEGGV